MLIHGKPSLKTQMKEGVIHLLCVAVHYGQHLFNDGQRKETIMIAMIPMFGAAGYALLYLLFGGGLGGALLIFIVAKMLGK
jgi:hypothetical protein